MTDTRPVEPALPIYAADEPLVDHARRTGEAAWSLARARGRVVVVGRGGDPRREVDLAACRADAVPLARRRGGGCAVLIDPGNLLVAAAEPLAGLGGIQGAFARYADWLVGALERIGVTGVRREGVSDLVWRDRKISGSCVYRARGLLLFSATLLVAPDVEAMERYLRHPPREPAYRAGRRHRDFVGALAGAGIAPDPLAFLARLEPALGPPVAGAVRLGPRAD